PAHLRAGARGPWSCSEQGRISRAGDAGQTSGGTRWRTGRSEPNWRGNATGFLGTRTEAGERPFSARSGRHVARSRNPLSAPPGRTGTFTGAGTTGGERRGKWRWLERAAEAKPGGFSSEKIGSLIG